MQWLVSILKLVLYASVQYFGLPLPNVSLTKTSFEFEEFSREDIPQTINDYKNYKKWFKFPAGIKGLF